jgi:hypothetical protein
MLHSSLLINSRGAEEKKSGFNSSNPLKEWAIKCRLSVIADSAIAKQL